MSRRKIELKTADEMAVMHQSGLILSRALDAVAATAKPGTTTLELDEIFSEIITEAGATSNFLGYYGYPNSICASVNDQVVHGIPNAIPLESGDVLKIDGGCILNGWHSDSARTVIVADENNTGVDPEDQRLSEITRKAMWRGIAAFASAKYVGEIGEAIETYVRAQPGSHLGILEEYVGHGIGTAMHQAPDVFNYDSGMRGQRIKPGLCLAIEPMLVRGGIDTTVLDDDWTVVTNDGSRASQWEHSVARHQDGIWVLTAEDGGASELQPLGVTPVPLPSTAS
ncbi:type I methionyl aminopeptidase [Auritidibacter ignavus]|uniref:type I methionyl aminopeptidase n=1 Tax=Auritidibacter ignavus TaxID=678932 RepID=UPI00109C0BEC|nr:type I methionyl aminopeptidase [Auritidibacter ignavus]